MATAGTRPESPIVVIIGPTASGKTALAVELAEQSGGEIICADSRTIYRGMDIGTAKPTLDEQRVPHWGLDLVNPGERFTAADFKTYALSKIEEIRRRDKRVFIVGGTGLYVNALIYDYQFQGEYDDTLRRQLSKLSIEELINYCSINNIKIANSEINRRRLIRTIEQHPADIRRKKVFDKNIIVAGIATERHTLNIRIKQRAEHMFDDGVVEEAKKLGEKYNWASEAMTGNIYPILKQYLSGEISVSEARELFETSDRQLVKKQMTWFRRDPNIIWGTVDDIRNYISTRI